LGTYQTYNGFLDKVGNLADYREKWQNCLQKDKFDNGSKMAFSFTKDYLTRKKLLL